jgi:CHAT domain-containing protein
MLTKKLLGTTLFYCLATFLSGFSQYSKPESISLDSVLTITSKLIDTENYPQAKYKIDSLTNHFKGKKQVELLNQLKINNLIGKYHLQTKATESWIELYEWSKAQKNQCKTDEENVLLVRLFSNAGVAFKRMSRLAESEEAYLLATEILRKLKNPEYLLSGSVYTNAGNSLKQKGEFERSIEYFEQSIQYFNDFVTNSKDPNSISRIAGLKSAAMVNLGMVYQSLNNHDKAISIFRNCIDFKLQYFPKDLNTVYSNLVNSLIEVGNYHEAKQFVDRILIDYKNGQEFDDSWALARLNLADINLKLTRDTSSILKELNALDQQIRVEIPKAVDVSIVANQYAANLLFQQGKHLKALSTLADALSSLSTNKLKLSALDPPNAIKTLKFNKLIELTGLNAQFMYGWGKKTSDLNILMVAEERYLYTLKLIDSLRNSLELQSSKLQVSKIQKLTYNQIIELQYIIFNLTSDSTYIERLFSTMEMSKSASLWSSVSELDIKASQIPNEELAKEYELRQKIANIQGKLLLAGPQSLDEEIIRDLQKTNLLYNQQMDSLKRVYRQKFPDYYQAKFDRTIISLDQVKNNLSIDQVLIEYAFAYDFLYRITVTKEKETLVRMPVVKKTLDELSFVLDFMKGHFESLTGAARSKYCEAASNLYELLIGQSATIIGKSEILIIPDESLSYLPFETLLVSPPNGNKQDYRKLPYLIRNHSICYGLTATLFFYQPSRISKPSRGVLAIAPTYDFSGDNISAYIKRAQSALPELQGTHEESRAIKRMLGGRLLSGRKATEHGFKSTSANYNILHLAMHTVPDKTNSLNSGLIFTPGADKDEDGVLFGHEVYNLTLNAKLAVLSACETGSGQMAGGEGVLSFGRAFIVAGCPNLVMTMWTVDDQSSQKLMVSFYKSIISGSGIADALQESKVLYLSEVDQLHAHPHYWAGFIELGQNQELNLSSKKNVVLYILLLFCLTIIILIFMQAKKNPRKSRDIMETEFSETVKHYRIKSEIKKR